MGLLSWQLMEVSSRIKKIWSVSCLVLKNETTYYPNHVLRFEREFANFMGTKHSVTFSNGTTAIEAALFALGIRPGDEIIAPSYTIHSTFSAALTLGITVRFADINPQTMTIDPEQVEKLINRNTKAVVAVHMWGVSSDMDRLTELVKKHNLFFVEDCSHCHGATWGDKRLGSFGDIGVFSLQGNKAIAAGEGGISITDDEGFLDRMLAYAHQGRRVSGTQSKPIESAFLPVTGFGRKARAHPFGIALARIDLRNLKKRNQLAKKCWEYVNQSIEKYPILSTQSVPRKSQMGGFYLGAAIRAEDSKVIDELQAILDEENILYERRNYEPYHKLPHLVDMDYRNAHLDGLDFDSDQVLSLPNTEWALRSCLSVGLKQFASNSVRKRWEIALTRVPLLQNQAQRSKPI